MLQIIGNVIGIVGAALMVYTGFLENKKHILFVQNIQIALTIISDLLLKGITGAIINAIGFIRNIFCYYDKLTIPIKIIISIISVYLSIKFNNLGFIGLLPVISMVVYIWLMTIKDDKLFKLLIAFTMLCWGVYDFTIGLYTFSIFDFLNLFASVGTVIKMIYEEKKKKKAHKVKRKAVKTCSKKRKTK